MGKFTDLVTGGVIAQFWITEDVFLAVVLDNGVLLLQSLRSLNVCMPNLQKRAAPSRLILVSIDRKVKQYQRSRCSRRAIMTSNSVKMNIVNSGLYGNFICLPEPLAGVSSSNLFSGSIQKTTLFGSCNNTEDEDLEVSLCQCTIDPRRHLRGMVSTQQIVTMS
jgi:hypothetical protein